MYCQVLWLSDSLTESLAAIEDVKRAGQPSPRDVVAVSELASSPPCNIVHPPLPSDFDGDVAEPIPIPPGLSVAKSSVFVSRPVSLPHLGRHIGLNFMGGSASSNSFSPLLLFPKRCCIGAVCA